MQENTMYTKNNSVGVIVGRFQTPYLHDGHRKLIDTAMKNHYKVLIFIGVSSTKNTIRDPLDYDTRMMMIASYVSRQMETCIVEIIPIHDNQHDHVWSANLDKEIQNRIKHNDSVVLYGGRDSFVGGYTGGYRSVLINEVPDVSATDIRNRSCIARDTESFRHGMIYASQQQYPIAYQTVDIAVINDNDEILMIQKEGDDYEYRFVGGFSDPNSPSLEYDARRELQEECGVNVNIGVAHYVSSRLIDDWRYKNNKNCKIKTAFFVAKHLWGNASPMSEITKCEWIHISMLSKNVVDEHLALASDLEHWFLHNKNKL
jgi:bifunctional NMN adenylyltransferase/nudix hydrolase